MVHAWNVEKKERKEECSWVQEKKKKKGERQERNGRGRESTCLAAARVTR